MIHAILGASSPQLSHEDIRMRWYDRHRSYRFSVTPYPAPWSWAHATAHAHHPTTLRPPVMRPGRQVVTETADDAPIPVSLVQYLCAQWWSGLSEERDAVIDLLGRLMASPRWHWPITALSAHVPTNLGSCVFEHDGQRTIGIPSTILWDI